MNVSSRGTMSGSGAEERVLPDRVPRLELDRDRAELGEMPADQDAVALASHFFAIAPAATRIVVSRADARPPPR